MASGVESCDVQARKPTGDACTEKTFFAGAETEEDADLALARVLQEQERELYFIAHQNRNELSEDIEGTDCDDGVYAAKLQAQELAYRLYTESEDMEERERSASQNVVTDRTESFSYEDFTTLGDAVGKVEVGVSTDKMKGLKTVKYDSGACTNEEDCAICRVSFEDKEDVLVLPCGHTYHSECIAIWFEGNKSCPICKREIE